MLRLFIICKFLDKGFGRRFHLDYPGRNTLETNKILGPDVYFDVPPGVDVTVKCFCPDSAGQYDAGKLLTIPALKVGKGSNQEFTWIVKELPPTEKFNRVAAVERLKGYIPLEVLAKCTEVELAGMVKFADAIAAPIPTEGQSDAAITAVDPAMAANVSPGVPPQAEAPAGQPSGVVPPPPPIVPPPATEAAPVAQ